MQSTQNRAEETSSGKKISRWVWWKAPVMCFIGGVLMSLAYPPYDLGNWVWVGLLPLLTALWRGEMPSKRRAFFMGWLYGMGWYCVSFWWIQEVGKVWSIPLPLFLAVAYVPLMAVYSCLPGLWALVAGRWLRPHMEAAPEAAGADPQTRKQMWSRWERADMACSLRCAVGCGALWVCIEWLRAHGTLGFSWNSLGMALYNGLSFAQWAEFVGTAALSFIPMATSVILWCAFRRTVVYFKGVGVGCRPWDFYGAVIVLFGLFAGGLALSKAYSPGVMLRQTNVFPLPVMGVQINKDQREHIEEGADVSQYHQYLNATVAAYNAIAESTMKKAQEHEELGITLQMPAWVVWPESALPYPLLRNLSTGALLRDAMTGNELLGEAGLPLARKKVYELGGPKEGFVLFTGVDELLMEPVPPSHYMARGLRNSMACIPGDFESICTVSKQHLMPFGEYLPLVESIEWIGKAFSEITGTQVGEGIRPGEGTEPILTPAPGTGHTVGVIPAVCYEDTVGDLLRLFVRDGAQVIVNVTNDAWFRHSSCGVQQARAAAFRCIELRRSMVRAANMGVTCCIAPNGGVIHALLKADGTPHLPGYSYAVLPVDAEGGRTLYARWGDWAVALCAALALLMCLPGWRRLRKERKLTK